MALDNYTDLLAEIQNWFFGRDDLASEAPTFVNMFEAKVNRKLFCRQMETIASATTNYSGQTGITMPSYVSLPPDYQTMRAIRVLNGQMGHKPSLKYETPDQIDIRRDEDDTPNQPVFYTVVGNFLEFYPTPDLAYNLGMKYRQNIPSIITNNTNWLLALAPDLYLHGSLSEAEPYLMNDERVAMWKSFVQEGFADLSNLSDQATYGSGPLVIRRNRRGY